MLPVACFFWHVLQNPGWGDSIACLQCWFALFVGWIRPDRAMGAVISLAAPARVQFVIYLTFLFLVTWLKALGTSRKKKGRGTQIKTQMQRPEDMPQTLANKKLQKSHKNTQTTNRARQLPVCRDPEETQKGALDVTSAPSSSKLMRKNSIFLIFCGRKNQIFVTEV